MKEFKCVIADPIGLHARPATLLVQAAAKYKSDSRIISGSREGNLKSIMNVMALGIKHGAEVTFRVTGEDEEEAVLAIEQALKTNNLI
ncbi:HPr family phosphocarrier protein [Mycoplasma sp. Ms02]|uniref:HPr family phosphocarrier protein n=1 Tax=Mycoplasma sp. Ms02 TaxID=353851 RepID=UPI001C8AE8A6|nr:HPr family phosphocarrier protein [Mycoplasma sp. Ms02]QZE12304.1 HPr family phosphocarrier protein [Mycoplasma sp. Ms02]